MLKYRNVRWPNYRNSQFFTHFCQNWFENWVFHSFGQLILTHFSILVTTERRLAGLVSPTTNDQSVKNCFWKISQKNLRNNTPELFSTLKKNVKKNRDFLNMFTQSAYVSFTRKNMKNVLCQKRSVCRPKVNLPSRRPWGFRLLLALIHCWKSTFYPGDIKNTH